MAFIPADMHPATRQVQVPFTGETLYALSHRHEAMTLVHPERLTATLDLRLPPESAPVLTYLHYLGLIPWPQDAPSTDMTPLPHERGSDAVVAFHIHLTPGLMLALEGAMIPFVLERNADSWEAWGETMAGPGDEHAMLVVSADDAARVSFRLGCRGMWHEVTEVRDWNAVVAVPYAPVGVPQASNRL